MAPPWWTVVASLHISKMQCKNAMDAPVLSSRATVKGEFGTLAAWNPFFDGQAALAAKAEAAFKDSNQVVEELLEKTRRVRLTMVDQV
jgi:hypothetical protein